MSTINDFRSKLTGGGARPSQFRVTLEYPTSVIQTGLSEKGTFLIKTATLPASTIQQIEVPFRGRMVKIAGERMFQNWQVVALNDNDFAVRKALEAWSSKILNHGGTNGILSPVDYIRPLYVEQLDRNDNALRKYKFWNCYPVNVSDIQLDFGNVNAIEEYSVEFSVDYWTVDGDTQIV